MRRQSKIKLLREILSRKVQNHSETPPSGAFMQIQKSLSANSRLKEIVSAKLSNKSVQPPPGAFETIQTGLNYSEKASFWSRYKVHTAVVILMIILISLFVIPRELLTNGRSTSEAILSTPQKAEANEKLPEEYESEKVERASEMAFKDTLSTTTIKLNRSSPVLPEQTNQTTVQSNGLPKTDRDMAQTIVQRAPKEIGINSQTNRFSSLELEPAQEQEVDFADREIQKAMMKPYQGSLSVEPALLTDWNTDSSWQVTYFQPRTRKFFIEIQPLYNQLMIENSASSAIRLSDNQQNLPQKLGFKAGGGALIALSDKLRLKTGLYYLQFTKQIEYSLFRSIQGLGSDQNPLFYYEGDFTESIESKMILGNISLEFDLYKNHYIGIEYDAGHSIGATQTRTSNIGLYFSLVQFKLGKFRYILEPHVTHPLASNKADYYSFRSNLVGLSLKVVR